MALFITLEGIEGCGKSSQAKRIADHLTARGHEVVLTFEPGATPVTAGIRKLLADPANVLDATAELMLFLADRAQHVATVVRPALKDGKIVVCDRYSDSTLAYQGYGRGHDLDTLIGLNGFAAHGLTPDLTLWIDCDIGLGLGRAKRRAAGPGDRFEAEPLSFHQRIRDGFAALAGRFPERFVRIDGDLAEEEVGSCCIAAVDATLAARRIH
ncbi:MAG TPA: dTMP kinase [Candidatus Limnocylindrales bacterium]|nr:dTMP kinase [Candidatus Limnocylindrales bacterium]